MALKQNKSGHIGLLEKLATSVLAAKADQIRSQVVSIAVKNGAGHIAPSLSSIDILTALYYNIMNLADSPEWENRDRLIYSKAHGCYGLYAILADRGYLEKNEWETLYQGSSLCGCVERRVSHGVEAGCGSLGHGLPMAVGVAFGAKLQNKPYRVYCVVGDGEMQEGSNWEALQFAVKHMLSNLTIIIDHNSLQAMDFLENILTVQGRKDDLYQKTKAFGCRVRLCPGHDPARIVSSVSAWIRARETLDAPQVLIAKTIKGYGVFCMENIPKFHFRIPTDKELKMGTRYE